MKNKICVYTCITGNYDNLRNPNIIEKNIDYYCFTNNKNIKSDVWKVVYIHDSSLTDAVLSRKIKLLGHKEINGKYDIYAYMDSCFQIVKPIKEFIRTYCDFSKHDYFVFKHHARKNIKEEMQACLFFGKENIDSINKLKEFYKKENYNYDNGLSENGIIIKINSEIVQKTMELWFDMICNYSGRDQLSFNYVASITRLNFSYIDLSIWANSWFRAYNHNDKKEKYSIYFKQKENDGINEYKPGDKTFNSVNIKDDEFLIDMIVPKKCNAIDIDVSVVSNYIIDKTIINSKKKISMNYINVYHYGDAAVAKNNDSILRLVGEFPKNTEIKVSIKLIPEKDAYLNNYVNGLINTNKELEKQYNSIINSKRWKLMNKIFKIFGK